MTLLLKLIINFTLLLQTIIAVSVNPMPAPRNITWDNHGPIAVSASMLLRANGGDPVLDAAYQRTVLAIRTLKWIPAAIERPIKSYEPSLGFKPQGVKYTGPKLQYVRVTISDWDSVLKLGVNESYSLKVQKMSNIIEISAATIWGALHAFTTLQQIIIYDRNWHTFMIEGPVEIWDEPLFKHRGVLIDTARNFITKAKMLEQLEVMSIAKMNVLHWHIEDSQSWPLELNIYPEMTKDAYSDRDIYTREDVNEIIQFARQRGIRIVPEIDLPGHARAGWRQIDEKIVVCGNSWYSNDNLSSITAFEAPPGQIDIIYDKTYEVLNNVFKEISEIFIDEMIHVGLDEVQENCYKFSPYISEWLKENISRSYDDLVQYWVDNSLPIFKKYKQKIVMWEDVLLGKVRAHNVLNNVILQSWLEDTSNIKKLTSLGYDVIVSSLSHLYLDCGHGGWLTNDVRYVDAPRNSKFNKYLGGSSCGPYKTWQRIYDFDFLANLSHTEKLHVLGGEVALWSEQQDSLTLIQSIWPRTAAFAESLWSGNRDPSTGFYRTNLATQRILNFREYLLALGHDASPLVPKFCLQNPHSCDLFYDQDIYHRY
ncbi:uncharacterized protein PRCAT00002941001 [Priceomyces carsonii]|uniref:uncharacterized protein n=1 Tax=Priceomyces carsonii TaxID=28549 RepID=UPI002EDB97A0|nr:unnamed protein product [Priceomyces carsonii]